MTEYSWLLTAAFIAGFVASLVVQWIVAMVIDYHEAEMTTQGFRPTAPAPAPAPEPYGTPRPDGTRSDFALGNIEFVTLTKDGPKPV